MKKFIFVILHYLNIDDTINCVDSIVNKKINDSIKIIIVDNASPNKSGNVLKEIYKEEKDIEVIINNENLGFSAGNNIGYGIAKRDKADFIIMCNNDTLLIEDVFFDKIKKEYEKSHFAVLGPQVILKNKNIFKYEKKLLTVEEYISKLNRYKLVYFSEMFYLRSLLKNIKNLFLKLKKKNSFAIKENNDDKRKENIILHGCFWIFSKEYIDKFEGLNSKTFLYCEEELLYLQLKKNNLKSVYNPDLKIIHNEDGATNALNKNNHKKELFVLKNKINALKTLINEMEGKNE